MSKAPVRFREVEVARALRAADRAGRQVNSIHIDNNGQVTLEIATHREAAMGPPQAATEGHP
jgi:hypothetical protein